MVTVAMAFPDGRGGQAGRCRHASGTHLLNLADSKRLEKSWVRTFQRKSRLKVDQAPDLSKDPGRFPGFDRAVASDLRTSLELFLEDVLWGSASDFRQLLLA